MAVLSGVDPYQLCVELVGEEHLGSEIIRKIKNLEIGDSVFRCTWALNERPKYIAEGFSPDMRHSGWIGMGEPGEKGMTNMMNEVNRLRKGLWPNKDEMFLRARDHSHYCFGYAPPGKAAVLTAVLMPSADHFSEQGWKEKEKSHTEEVLQMWGRYAPNITWDNVIGYFNTSPYYISKVARNYARHGTPSIISSAPSQMGRNRPIPELASGRMPIKNLYATGSGWHPSGGSNPFQGYIIYKVMAEDLGLRKHWEETGRPY
jgi:phytoene dehydrogenase-like protein